MSMTRAQRRCLVIGLGAVWLLVTGCESMGTAAQSKTAQGAVLGGALGAGTGAIIGNQSDHPGKGAAIGAGLGALAGGLVGHGMEEQDRSAQSRPATSSGSTSTARTKFCPVGGEMYSEDVKYCPIHGVELRYKE